LAIYIDIIARLNQRQLIKQGDDLRKYINGLENEIRDRGVRGAQGATKKLIKLDDDLISSRDQLINKSDELTRATRRLEAAEARVLETRSRIAVGEKAEKQLEQDRIDAAQERADAEQNLVYKLQAAGKALRDKTRSEKDLNEETKAHAKNLRDVAKITDKNRGKFIRLSMVTNRLRRDTENLHAANVTILQDNTKVSKSMEGLADATKKTAREREKYNEVVLTKNPARIKAQGLVVQNALEAEARKARDVGAAMVEVIERRREHDVVVTQNERSLRGLANQSLKLEQQSMDLRSANRDVIEQNITLTRQFDRVGDSVKKVALEYRRYHEMSQDGSVSSDALAVQIERINDAYVAQQRVVRDSSAALDNYYEKQAEAQVRAEQAAQREEARLRAQEARDRAKLKPQSAGQYIARNLGALTPLGTLSPTAIVPFAAVLATVGEAVVTASQSLALLPAAAYAATAGITTLIVGFKGFGDALSNMGDPKKFAEALYQLSPNAQQAALSIKNLVDGPLGELKRATQDALFVNVSPTLQKLVQTFGPTLQSLMTSIATSFNQMFTGISFEFMTPETQQRVSTIANNIASMFDRLTPGVLALVSAFTKIAETGSGFLPGLADGFTGLMVSFDNFITRAQEDGSLQNFMSKGIEAVKAISRLLFSLGQDIYDVFGNKSPEEFMVALDKIKGLVVNLFKVFEGIADALAVALPVLDSLIGDTIGWKNAVFLLAGAWGAVKLFQILKWMRDVKAILPGLTAGFKTVGGAVGLMGGASAAVASSGAAITSTAKTVGANTASTFAAAGTKAGKGFGSNLMGALKTLPWVGLGVGIAAAIEQGVRSLKSPENSDSTNKAIDDLADGFDPGKALNPSYWIDKFFPNLRNPNVPSAYDGSLGPGATPPSVNSEDWFGGEGDFAGGLWRPDVWMDGGGGYDFPLPNVPLDENGKALTDTEILDKIRGELPRDSYAVDPFTNPITGQKLTPMLPMGENGMPSFPTGGTPGTPSIQGPIMPQYNSFGQMTGYGANMVDPQEVFDAQLAVVDRAGDLEEANKDLLAAKKAGILSAEEVHDLDRKVLDGRISLHKALVQLGKAQTGDVEKLKTETDNAKDALGDFGAEIDKDFGISKGLTGIAENLTKFLANLALAPVFGAIRGAQAGLGFPQGEGVGSGLTGMAASSMGWYKGGPLDPGREEAVPGAPAYAPSGSPSYSPNWYRGGALDAPVSPRPASVSDPSAWVGGAGDFGTNFEGGGAGPAKFGGKLPGINLSTIPVAAQQYANNCINAAAQIILSAGGVNMSQDQLDGVIARGGGISSLSAGLNRLSPSGGFKALEASGGSPDVLFKAVKDSVDRGVGSVLNVAPGQSIAGRDYPSGHFIAVTGYDPRTGRINLSDTGDGSMYSVSAEEAFRSSRGRGLVAGTGARQGLPSFAKGGEIPIMAHSGEHVLTRDDVSAMGGQSAVYNFRRSLHSYELGGEPVQPANLGELLGVGDSPPPPKPPALPPARAPRPPAAATMPGAPIPASASATPATPGLPAPPAAEAPVIPVPPALPAIPQTVLPPGTETPGTVIGAQVEAPAGYGEGLSIGGGIIGALQGAAQTAISAGGLAADAAGGFGGGSAGAAVASAALQIGFEELNRAIEFGGQVASIAMQGLSETFLPAGGSELAANNWGTRLLGGLAGAAPAIANLAGGANAKNQSMLPGVGPPTPEQIAAQGMDPNRGQHTGAAPAPGPFTAVNIETYNVTNSEDRAGQDLARYYAAPGAR